MSRLNITVLSIRGSRVQPTKYTIFAHFYCRNIPVREEGGTPLWATSFSVTAAETLILSAVRQSVSRSVGARPVLWNIFRLFFRLPGLTCTHLFLFFNGGPLISVKMLWKLADNVKYEDDCEVSVGKARTGKKSFVV